MLAHELCNRLGAAMLAFAILTGGHRRRGGSTGALLGRSLRGMRDLVNNALADVRIEVTTRCPEKEADFGRASKPSLSPPVLDLHRAEPGADAPDAPDAPYAPGALETAKTLTARAQASIRVRRHRGK